MINYHITFIYLFLNIFHYSCRITPTPVLGNTNNIQHEFCSTKDKTQYFKYESNENADDPNSWVPEPWPNGVVPYRISWLFNRSVHAMIENSMAEINNASCVKFVPRSFERNYLFVYWDLKCESRVGHVIKDGEQALSLSPSCLNKNDILHELMHVLGFSHEHNRADRNDYVDILWDNMHEDSWQNFMLYSTNTVHQSEKFAYDYRSVLHYGSLVASKNGLPTIVPKSKNFQIVSNGLSEIDVLKINTFYRCSTLFYGNQKILKLSNQIAPLKILLPPQTYTTEALPEYSKYSVNCDHDVRWRGGRALEIENYNFTKASILLQNHLQYWYQGRWSVIYHKRPLTVGWSVTDHRENNYCHIKTEMNDVGIVAFEECTFGRKIYAMNCNAWYEYLKQLYDTDEYKNDIKIVVEQFYKKLKQEFGSFNRSNNGTTSSFTVFCDKTYFSFAHNTENFCQGVLGNELHCMWYQH